MSVRAELGIPLRNKYYMPGNTIWLKKKKNSKEDDDVQRPYKVVKIENKGGELFYYLCPGATNGDQITQWIKDKIIEKKAASMHKNFSIYCPAKVVK